MIEEVTPFFSQSQVSRSPLLILKHPWQTVQQLHPG